MRIRVRARIAEYPLEVTKPLVVQDQALAQVATLCENTLLACLQDGFVDCVWRESSQWVGDALPQALTLLSMCDDVRPLRQVIVQAAQGAYPDGILPSVVPGEVHAYTIPSYGFWWIELLRIYRAHTGDDTLVGELWPALVKMLDRFHADLRADGLIYAQPGRRFYVDWSPMSNAQPNAAYNLEYVWALQRASELAAAHGARDAARWQARAEAVRAAARAAFWDGARWWDDRERTTWSQLTASFALLTGAAQPDEAPALLDEIAARSLDLSDGALPGTMTLASPFMHHFVFEALRAFDRHADAVELIRRRWGRWATAGCPTTWENWNVDFPDGSECHAFSAHPRYHLAEIAKVMAI